MATTGPIKTCLLAATMTYDKCRKIRTTGNRTCLECSVSEAFVRQVVVSMTPSEYCVIYQRAKEDDLTVEEVLQKVVRHLAEGKLRVAA